jgi:Pentatricopeptide repeat domain/PPR repeat
MVMHRRQHQRQRTMVSSYLYSSFLRLLLLLLTLLPLTFGLNTFQQARANIEQMSLRNANPRQMEAILQRLSQETARTNRARTTTQQRTDEVDPIELALLYATVLQAWSRSKERGAGERAEAMLLHMQRLYQDGSGSKEMQPTIDHWNCVLQAYARVPSVDQIRRILDMLQDQNIVETTSTNNVNNINVNNNIVPNQDSYRALLKAYTYSKRPDATTMVVQTMEIMQELADSGRRDMKPDYLCHQFYIKSILECSANRFMSHNDAMGKSETHLLRMMNSEDPNVNPSIACFHDILGAWAKSSQTDLAERAKSIFEMLEDYHAKEKTNKSKPVVQTYNTLLQCYARSKTRGMPQQALTLLQEMQRLADTGINPDAAPDNYSFNHVMNAIVQSRQANAPYQVEQLLQQMKKLAETSGGRVGPCSRTFNLCCEAWGKSGLPESEERIRDWMTTMEQSTHKPDQYTYNSLLNCFAKLKGPDCGRKAENVLQIMLDQYEQGNIQVKPDVVTMSNVVHCWGMSQTEESYDKAIAILNKMDEMHTQGFGSIQPNGFTYNSVINAVAKSTKPNKARLAKVLLERMSAAGIQPNSISYNAVLNACVHVSHPHDDPKEIVTIAFEMCTKARESKSTTFITYGAMFRVLTAFVNDPNERWNLVKSVFESCCADGQLTKPLLDNQVAAAVTFEQLEVLRKHANDQRTGKLKLKYTQRSIQEIKSPRNKYTDTRKT